MAFKLSTGLRNGLLVGDSLKDQLDGGYIHIYAGTPPESADDENTNTLLATIKTEGATGLMFAATPAEPGTLYKAADDWDNRDDNNFETGIATHFLFVGSTEEDGEAITASSTNPRILGTVGGANADLILSDTTLTENGTQQINSFFVAIPEQI